MLQSDVLTAQNEAGKISEIKLLGSNNRYYG
jgi:hypothetical protein